MRSFRTILAGILLLVATRTVFAGANAGGTLIMHANSSVVYTHDRSDYCASANLDRCSDATVSVTGSRVYVCYLLAAFPSESSPRLAGLTLGLRTTSTISIVNFGSCADFELADSDWPDNGRGTSLTWNTPQTSRLTPVYWFAAYNYYAPQDDGTIVARPHPTQGGYFADDSIPSVLDPIHDYGMIGFGTGGYLPCPGETTVIGACCLLDGRCINLSPSECAAQGGTFRGGDVPCSPTACEEILTGACCYPGAVCEVMPEFFCNFSGGSYSGDDTDCDPNPCPDGDPGACCLSPGGCMRIPPGECEASGGLFLGENVFCDPNPCPDAPAGACCASDGGCSELSELLCLQSGGVYKGDKTTCESGACATLGACCFPGLHCVQLTEIDCALQKGEWIGDEVPCEAETCGVPCPGRGLAIRAEHAFSLPAPLGWPGKSIASRDLVTAGGGDLGPNAGGVLLLHTNPSISYTFDDAMYCAAAPLGDCSDAITREDRPVITGLHVFAAFPDSSSPRLAGVAFGVQYGGCVEVLNWGACTDFESPDPEWPDSGEGTGLAFDAPRTTQLTELYWFVTYVQAGVEDEFRLIPHPAQGAYFADDAVPAVLDPIVDLGAFGFNRPGYLPCPDAPPPPPPIGACCDSEGDCIVTTQDDCQGHYSGDDVPCDPNPCQPVPTRPSTWGSVKRLFR